ncbi:MAG: transglycosylase SLT domain-containing protein [Burkholderiales bacterium]
MSAAPAALCLLFATAASAQTQADLAEPVNVVALRTEARAYEHGEGVPKNPHRAVELYCEAARLGDAEAQFSLGWIYANGRGVSRDDGLASVFFQLAAQQGHEHAIKMQRFVGDAPAVTPECLREKQPPQIETAGAGSSALDAMQEFVAVTLSQKKALELVNRLAPEFGINPRLALAVIRAESNFDAAARSEKNAQGLMQLIPETSARFNVAKPFDPVQNIRGGLAYLRWLLAYFQGNVTLVAAAYNAGEGTVNRYRGIPPFAETRAYVKRIVEFFGKSEHPYDAGVTGPSPEINRIRSLRGS